MVKSKSALTPQQEAELRIKAGIATRALWGMTLRAYLVERMQYTVKIYNEKIKTKAK